jgi:hypothetical protein
VFREPFQTLGGLSQVARVPIDTDQRRMGTGRTQQGFRMSAQTYRAIHDPSRLSRPQ